jgi:NAD(P)-dependent dehydrogenase (short-subunit alcohol dehydrogenase family)
MIHGLNPDADGSVFGLEGRVAVVAGATSCGGRTAAVLLARAGASVAIFAVDGRAASKTARLIVNEGGTCIAVPVDVVNPADGAEATASVAEIYGSVDVLVNDLGGLRQATADHHAAGDALTLGVSAMMLMVRHVEPLMRLAGGGAIVNVASAVDDAVVRLSQAMALEHGEQGIRVNCVVPGSGPNTGMAVLFLSSILASGVSGAVIGVDPGPADKTRLGPGHRR